MSKKAEPIIHQPVFRIYLSHQIRGPNGNAATKAEIEKNIQTAKDVGREIQAYVIDWEKMDGFPPIDIYVPGDHDEFVQIAYTNGFITETQILAVDCEIISKCQLVIMYGDYYSKGMNIEYNYALDNNIAVFKMPIVCQETIEALQFAIYLLLKARSK